MRRLIACICILAAAATACGGSSTSTSSGPTTTDATAYATAYSVCLQFNNTDVARNAEPQKLSDDDADKVFYGLAVQLRPATKKDPGAWTKLQKVADKLRAQLSVKSKATDDQIESTITKMAERCRAARRKPTSLPTVPTTTAPSGNSTSTSLPMASTSVTTP